MQLSVVIAAHNESRNLPTLVGEICTALSALDSFEIVVVDDGSTDDTQNALNELQESVPELRVVRHRSSCGQSQAVMTGIDASIGEVVATLDGDGQNDPADLPAMLRVLKESAADGVLMVAGHRTKRQDSYWRILSSRIANSVRSRILADGTPDTGCGIKIFFRDAFMRLPRFNHMHRFLPALIVRGGGRVVSFAVNHRPRMHGRSHYDTLRRLMVGIVDLIGVAWLIRRNSLPEIERLDGVRDEREGVDSIRFSRPAGVLGPVRRAVA